MLLSLIASALGANGASLDAPWSDIAVATGVWGATEDRTVTYPGASRTFAANFADGTLNYRINSGAWTAYSAAVTVESGETLAWRWRALSAASDTVIVSDQSTGATVDSFTVTAT